MEYENKSIKDFTDLRGWQEAHKLALVIYKLTNTFPKEERYSLADQIRRAAVSITSNIAEGFSRHSSNEKVHFYSMARGSSTELQNQLILGKDLTYIPQEEFDEVFEQSVIVNKLVNGLIKSARKLDNYT